MSILRSTAVAALALFFAGFCANPSHADWINLTGAETAANIAEITILDDRVRVVLEIYVRDLKTFEELLPDDWLSQQDAERPSLAERLKTFSSGTFQIVTEDGTRLQAEAKRIEARSRKDRFSPYAGMINPYTRRAVRQAPADKRVLYAELEYPFAGKPAALTFIPPTDANGVAAVTIGFIAYHKAVPIIDFRYLSAQAKVNLDWDDPWYSKFDSPGLKRHHKNALMSFLYVEPREVRHEVLVRARDLQEWTDLGLKAGTMIGPDEQMSLKTRARAFFESHNPLRIDGKPFTPAASRAEFLTISLRGLQVIEEARPLDYSTAVIGIILSYPVKHLPDNVTVDWELFNPRIDRIPTTATDPAGPLKGYIDKQDRIITWQNYLRKYVEPAVTPVALDDGRKLNIPVASLILVLGALIAAALVIRPRHGPRYAWAGGSLICIAGAVLLLRIAVVEVRNPFAGPPAEPAAARIVTAILDNVHTAYLERNDGELARALGIVVAEEGYADVKTELSRALAIKVAGGGIARVNAIEGLAVKDIGALDGRSGFRTVAEWTALANAGHWGHAHRRRIRFRALMELEDIDGTWKLAGLTVLDARQAAQARP